jgi:hypothetical protein
MITRVNKPSYHILRTIVVPLLLAGAFIQGTSCGSSDMSESDVPVPFVPFNEIVINLSLPTYNRLRSDGGYVYIDGGVRGMILYRQDATTYLAFERNCTFRPNDACATVEVHSSTLYMTDECCKSIFRFPDGEANGGPASRPLIQYSTSLRGSELTIVDERF